MLGSGHKWSSSYVARLENKHPGYLQSLYQYTVQTLEGRVSYAMLTICMKKHLRADPDSKFVLNLSRRALNDWFILNCGREILPIEKQLDREDHK